ncbi:hypothetical protein PR048_018745 [Dryococelus australis]|uniref:Uncharacterized protein n=1 Tax=Dryococelus australis TaxID=614101 RepID=A0ABQ9HD43_9NEOP|nr:hypothetical protein PR048_018745 [Dryococelus australis]
MSQISLSINFNPQYLVLEPEKIGKYFRWRGKYIAMVLRREGMLIEVYMREVLYLTIQSMSNFFFIVLHSCMINWKQNPGLLKLWYTAMLFPLVESCLTEDLLYACQCSAVGHQDEYNIALNVFNESSSSDSKWEMVGGPAAMEASSATAEGLVNTKGKISAAACIFCQGAHFSGDSLKAWRMTVVEKCQIIDKNKCCFVCLISGHITKGVKSLIWYVGPHTYHEKTLSNYSSPDTLLQILIITIQGKKGERRIIIVNDSGSQRSCVTKKWVLEMGHQSTRVKQLRYGLFGDHRSSKVNQTRFHVILGNIYSNYVCNLDDHDGSSVCVYMLAGVAGKLLTGEKLILENGLVAVNAYLE